LASGLLGSVGRVVYAVEVMVADGEFGCVAEVVEEGWHWVDAAFGQAEALASVLASEGCQ
jgi:hypothetical protein